ncbi:hypothetical protein CGMCC3_g2191 [Colletotrichum fructicola]|nr:uncharacterized protein CGMCC3_g2191 [Colletotrichum fructicola]KAE9581836.1 hypothetical protein CGMCC3_g2191 [Colletotrichum fructicola]
MARLSNYNVFISRTLGRETPAARYPSTCPKLVFLDRTTSNQSTRATPVIGAVPMLRSNMLPLEDAIDSSDRQKWILVQVRVGNDYDRQGQKSACA